MVRGVRFLIALVLASAASDRVYTVQAERVAAEAGAPVIDKVRVPGSSVYDFNYNPASFTVTGADGAAERWLMVRVQNRTAPANVSWAYGGPSQLAVARVHSPTNVSAVAAANVVFGDGVNDVEDPRIVQVDGTYYMYYTKSDLTCTPNPCSRLALATATTAPLTAGGWTDEGPLWPDRDVAGFQWTKSGACLPSADLSKRKHLLIWSNWCEFEPLWVSPLYVNVAVSDDLRHWDILPSPFMDKRKPGFDSYVLESGAPPVKLSSGDWLFLYNGARQCPTGKPQYERCYALGWAVLDADDPTRVVARSAPHQPVLTPQLEWEVGNPDLDQTPNAVFLSGALFPDDDAAPGTDSFIGFYGGGDTAIGAMRVTVGMS